jgi:hypothetical protein
MGSWVNHLPFVHCGQRTTDLLPFMRSIHWYSSSYLEGPVEVLGFGFHCRLGGWVLVVASHRLHMRVLATVLQCFMVSLLALVLVCIQVMHLAAVTTSFASWFGVHDAASWLGLEEGVDRHGG